MGNSKSIEQFLNHFTAQPNKTNINNPEIDDGSVETPLVSHFPHSDNDSDDEEVLIELSEYKNAGTLRRERITIFLWDDPAYEMYDRHPYEKNKFMYKNCLNLGPEYQVDENMKEWLIRRHVIFYEKKLGSS
ncbi:hypothetical protein Tco_0252356 [Tanacetum coccineum]